MSSKLKKLLEEALGATVLESISVSELSRLERQVAEMYGSWQDIIRPNPMRNSIVVDLDNTLCNHSSREHLAFAGQWDDYHALSNDDKPWEDVERVINSLSMLDYSIIAVTGRNEKYRQATVDWMFKYQIHIDYLLMRPDNCFESDTEIKPRLLKEFCEEVAGAPALECILMILEDRDKMVETWRNLGFTCWQVRPGGF